MSPRRTGATAARVLRQLRHDPRTIGLILLLPAILLIVLRYVFQDASGSFSSFAPLVLGIFPFTIMFVVTSIATLRERMAGTLERLMTLPLAKLDLLLGYALAFALLAVLQSLIATGTTYALGAEVQGSLSQVITIATLSGLTGMALGLFFSAFATSEFQAVQFMPAFVLPQVLICGLFIPRDQMAELLQWFSSVMPLTYIVKAMQEVASGSGWSSALIWNLVIIAGFGIGALLLAAATLRRRH